MLSHERAAECSLEGDVLRLSQDLPPTIREIDDHKSLVTASFIWSERPRNLVIEVQRFGMRGGWPVFIWHGTPGYAGGLHPLNSMLWRMGIDWIAISRPGYSDSSRIEGRSIADSAPLMEAVVMAHGMEQQLERTGCSTLGRSGGGSSALACAALLPQWVRNASIFSSMGPLDLIEGGIEGMSADNKMAYGTGGSMETMLLQFEDEARASQENAYYLLEQRAAEASVADQRFLQGPEMSLLIAESHAKGMASGHYGRLDDVNAAQKPWEFDIRDIMQPVFVIQGEDDPWTPVQHWRWLVNNLPNAYGPPLLPDVGHMGTLKYVPDFLAYMKRPDFC
jgi:pimeloyl-ACP methyl ester carboxylesterase